jgi:hypothetical protein
MRSIALLALATALLPLSAALAQTNGDPQAGVRALQRLRGLSFLDRAAT